MAALAGVMPNRSVSVSIETSGLSSRYIATVLLLAAQAMFEYFDFYVVGYLVAVLAPTWRRAMAESSIILLSAGVGSIAGALVCGWAADRIGRRLPILLGGFLYTIASGLIALIPEGSWISLSVLRFLVGFGMAGAITIQVPLVLEFTPTRHRTLISSLMNTPISLGLVLAALLSSVLQSCIRLARPRCDRGRSAFSSRSRSPSSCRKRPMAELRWQARRRPAQLREIAGILPENIEMPNDASPPTGPVRELLQDNKSLYAWAIVVWLGLSTTTYGIQLWGPTLVVFILGISIKNVAIYFIYISLVGTAGRVFFSLLPLWTGRRAAAMVMAYGSTATTLGAALLFQSDLFGVPLFVILLAVGAIFTNGGFANVVPYTVEVFPVGLAGRGSALTQAANGVGKILGPLCLAVIAGAGDVVSPKATLAALQPAFLFLALLLTRRRRHVHAVPIRNPWQALGLSASGALQSAIPKARSALAEPGRTP